MGKDVWRPECIRSILTNEKYKGDARLQKTYVEDFLTKKVVINYGQRKQWYITDSHDAIIDPAQFDLVQQEIMRRCARKGKFYGSPFSNKLICGVCGAYYVHRNLHPNRQTSQIGWSCSDKYRKKGLICPNRFLLEEEIERGFIEICNHLFAERPKLVEKYEQEILPLIYDTSYLEQRILDETSEINAAYDEAEKLVADNARRAKSQDDYAQKLNSISERINTLKASIESNKSSILDKHTRSQKKQIFLNSLKATESPVTKFDIPTWFALVNTVKVMPDKSLIFTLNDGTIETIMCKD